MKVLICDHDATSRFVIRRLLTQHLPCTCYESGDGVEALQLIDEHDIALVILDVDMPEVDGVEVLEAIRSSEAVKSTPVIVISRERREEIVGRLLRLGVSGYLLKPIRTEKLLMALDGLRERLARRRPRRLGASNGLSVGPDSPALLVDGNLDYRHFFVTQTQKFGPVIGVPSGAAALSKFRQSPTPVVFVGADIGVLSAEMLIPKLRGMSEAPVRVVGIVDTAAPEGAVTALFDDILVRTYVPEKFKTEFKRFVKMPAALSGVIELGGDLGQHLSSAARQVFGMMLDTELESRTSGSSGEMAGALVDMTVQQRYVVTMKVFTSVDDLKAIASRMLQMPVEELTDEDYLSTATELANLLTGRLKASFEERGVAMDCSLPRLETTLTTWLEPRIEERGVAEHVYLTSAKATMSLALEVRDAANAGLAEVA